MPHRIALTLLAAAALAAVDPYEVDALQRQAEALRLAEDAEWTTLLHVERGWHGIRRSLVDDPGFFLAADGKRDPAAELRADLAALVAPTPLGERPVYERFPARSEFLVRRLGLDRARLPVGRDDSFEQAYAGLGPRSVAVAFPTAYMNTPASMFGHTLLLIRSRVSTGMASQAVNYAASTGHDGGVAFALKGVLGGYDGYYSLLPYWQKLNEYSDLDQRDVWEYELQLSPEEIRRLLLHIWEMRGIRSDYFFFDENCAYYLLYLVDVARPGLRLHEQASAWVIPLDTVRILRDAGLVGAVAWRPSLATRVRSRAAGMDAGSAAKARRLALGVEPLVAVDGAPSATADELDLAADYMQALRNRQKIGMAEFQQRMVPLLQARSRIATPPREVERDPDSVPPDQGHGSLRLGVGGGSEGGAGYGEFQIRPAYHDILDPGEGYVLGAQIDFCSLALRWYEGGQRPVVQRFDAIGLRSFTPRDDFFAGPSWKVDTGMLRARIDRDGTTAYHAFVDFGVGACWPVGNHGLAYAMLDADGRVVDTDPSVALGIGPEAGALLTFGRTWAVNPLARWATYIGDLLGDNWQVGLRARATIHRDLAVVIEAWRRETWDFLTTEVGVRVQSYF